jgi:hypothetical protein
MAVLRCPECGDLYLVATDRCESCGAALTEVAERERAVEPSGRPTLGAGEHERWELHEWTMEGRRLLDGMLVSAGIPRAWQGSTLLAPVVEHDRVADMVDGVAESDARIGAEEPAELDALIGVEDTSEPAELDALSGVEETSEPSESGEPGESGESVAYDLSGWDVLARGDLIAALADAGIEHQWDADDDLVVASEDEERVDSVFAELTPIEDDDEPEDDFAEGIDDGLLVQETLSNLFIAADRLQHNPLDGTSSRQAIEARDVARTLRLPFGFEPVQWQAILGSADELVASVQPDAPDPSSAPQPDDAAIRDAAVDLRRRLREVV